MIRRIPAKRHRHGDKLVDSEFSRVYDTLKLVNLGPFRFVYSDEENALYMQVKPRDGGRYVSVMKVDRDGNLSTTGTHTASATLENLGA